MAKVILTDVANLYGNTTGAESSINTNFDAVSTELDNTLSRDGKAPNQMLANLDMNSYRITNLANAINPQDAVPLAQLQSVVVEPPSLNEITDVTISAPVLGDRLVYDGLNWTNQNPTNDGVSVVNDLLDVSIDTPQTEQALVYDSSSGLWTNQTLPSGVTDHGALNGLSDDDHPQYLTPTRGAAYFPSINVTITGLNSISGGGNLSANRTLQLVNDVAAPGTSRYYGTNATGTKGWYALPVQNTDHGTFTGLTDDDHPQYINTVRGDARYSQLAHTHTQYTENAQAETITGQWAFTTLPRATAAGPFVYHDDANMTGGRITVSASPPSGGVDGDIWFVTE